MDVTSPSMAQHDLPGILPTPGRGIQQFNANVQGNWDNLMEFMKRQEKAVNELTQVLKASSSHHENQISDLAAKVESNNQQVVTLMTAAKQQEAAETDQLIKAVQLMITKEMQKMELSFTSIVQDKVERLRMEVQKDIKVVQCALQASLDHATANLQQCETQIDNCRTCVTELQRELQVYNKQNVEPQTERTTTQVFSTHPIESVSTPLPVPLVKSDHIKLTFPTFGQPTDDSDPLLYLTKCQDFLALHPLSDADLLATFRTVLHGTARDWWEVRRSNITTWKEFETAFLSAFLSEDYEDELAERVRTRVQGEKESVRDFAFTYRALCKKWKATLTENEIVKMILKNIKPYLASQLRSRVKDLVRLGHQLERDHEEQLRYEGRGGFKQQANSQKHLSNRPAEKPSVQCWRCNGPHPPGNCPTYVHSPPQQSSGQQLFTNGKYSHHSAKSGGRSSNNNVAASEKTQAQVGIHTSRSNVTMTIPQQLVVPIRVGPWSGKAILDTGASYTLIHESLMKQIATPDELQPWTSGPLYLANGKAESPLGWININIHLHNKAFTVPAVVLSSQALAYAIILGLDFIFFSGLPINVSEPKYSFKSDLAKEHPFQLGNASEPLNTSPTMKEGKRTGKNKLNLTLLSAVPPPQSSLTILHMDSVDDATLIRDAVSKAQLSTDGKQQLLQILESNPRVCTHRTGRTDVLQHRIYTTCQVPIKQRPYRLSPVKQQAMEEQLEVMLKEGIVEPSHSAWASPVVLVPKKNGNLKFCVDYRKVNATTESDAYPLPNIAEILESLSGASIFATIDLNSGYWQVEMDPDSKAKTAFIVSAGLYHFNVMPFGLKNTPATFQRLMETVLGELRKKICFVYIDDIIIYSTSVAQHFCDLKTILHRLETAGLTINLKKCKFFLSEITFLGHVVSNKGITADPSKVEAIRAFPAPNTLKEVQRFLGLAGWYHRFVPNFSKIAEPLNSLKKKGQVFKWMTQCQQAFDQLKACLTSPPILGHPDLQVPFIVYTDASDTGLGAILTQRKDLGKEEVIAYASRTLTGAEINYTATEKECLAVIWALEKWEHYLEYKLFTVVTDHSALQWVMGSTKTNSRLIRWVLRLQKLNFIIEYRKGKLNVAPDALSRSLITANSPITALYAKQKTDQHPELPVTDIVLWEEQHNDCEITKLLQAVAEEQSPQMDQYEVVEDKLYHKTHLKNDQIHYRVYVPGSLRSALLQHYHSHPLSGHCGIYKTYKRLQEVAFWPGMWTDVKHNVRECVKCQTLRHDNRKPAGKLQPITTTKPNEMLGVDIMGPLSRSTQQNEYLLVFVDYYSRWVEFFPMRHATAQSIATILRKEILTRWGVPDFILSDRGTQFVSSVFKEVCEKWKVTPKLTTAYHPQTNMTERVNRTLKNMIASYVDDNHNKWDQFLPEMRFAINSAIQETTGVTPAELHLGRKLKGPMDKILHGPDLTPDTNLLK
ncbi:Transposon Ty3-I Gag-Pol poly [Labeo rohita]|uniref:Gypsy retrotransposon integrase-like protein 1 n=1 Tax=Labeo rohita TaxID=84645 RepID=A0A498LY78_LABRO|nr:Transposon Ty3-I Gag-Pol poly [Labeo rohita]